MSRKVCGDAPDAVQAARTRVVLVCAESDGRGCWWSLGLHERDRLLCIGCGARLTTRLHSLMSSTRNNWTRSRTSTWTPVTVAGSPGLWVEGSFRTSDGESAEWCVAASRTTGRLVHFVDSRSAGLLLLIVDKRTYAIGYGQGHRLLSSDEKDRRFGLEFAIRALDPKQVSKLMRRRPGARGRTEVTRMPSGSSIWAFDVSDAYADLVGGPGGKSESLQLSHTRPDRPVPVDGGVGLRIRLATDPDKLVADIRIIAEVLDRERIADLEFADRMRPFAGHRHRRSSGRRP